MAVISIPSTTSLIKRLRFDYPHIRFIDTGSFSWNPLTSTIEYAVTADMGPLLLHELGHACLGHSFYTRDIQLLEMERTAWDYAQSPLSSTYKVCLNIEQVETALDTYRAWLHQRSLCPVCGSTGIEERQSVYRCPACQYTWRPNQARTCALRRYVK